jgi:hypothetical protein
MSTTETSNRLEKLTEAARKVLRNGYYLFPLPPGGKVPYKGSRGQTDARNDESALCKWVNQGLECNPAIALRPSNLTVLDIDSGMTDDEHALSFAKLILGVETKIVRSGKRGYHFYFVGQRTLPDAVKGYVNGDLTGDLKSHSYVVAEGGIHPDTGRTYEVINPGVLPAPLPDVIRDCKKEKQTRTKQTVTAKDTTDPAVERSQYSFTKPTVMTRKIWAGRRYDFLRDQAYWLRRRGLGVEAMIAALADICTLRCADGAAYVKQEGKLRGIAEFTMKYAPAILYEPKGPKPEPELWRRLRELLPVNTICSVQDLKLSEPTLLTTKKTTLARARKALNICTYGRGKTALWERKEGPRGPSEAPQTGQIEGSCQQYGIDKSLIPIQMGRNNVDMLTGPVPAIKSTSTKRTEYMRRKQRERRARLREAKTQAQVGHVPLGINQIQEAAQ